MILVTLDAPKKRLQNLFNAQRQWVNVEKIIKLYLQLYIYIIVYLPILKLQYDLF